MTPGDTARYGAYRVHDDAAQRRPGSDPRRHPTRPARAPTASTSLNEGRGVTPGDTSEDHEGVPALAVGAQRRPGSDPRRHANRQQRNRHGQHAQRRPGSDPRRHGGSSTRPVLLSRAQRRPGSDPRRHGAGPVKSRSPQTAQRRPGSDPRRHLRSGPPSSSEGPLNEGRGVTPGDTLSTIARLLS